jgi:hypothetical protein
MVTRHHRFPRQGFTGTALALLALAAGTGTAQAYTAPATQVRPGVNLAVSTVPTAQPRVFAYYYLWWSSNHWYSALGGAYPFNAKPLPLPATVDSTGCNPKAAFAGATLTDVPATLAGQDDPGMIEAEVRQAASAGLAGFNVNWAGDGTTNQTIVSNVYTRRLQLVVNAVHKINAEGIPFKLWLSYKASAQVLPVSYIQNDLAFFLRTYGADPAFDRAQSTRLTVIWNGSRKYSLAILKTVSTAVRSKVRLLGDETTWSTARGAYLDGDAYYWSSQNPYGNPQSFQQIQALSAAVRASGRNPDGSVKVWVAPVTPGYDKQLAGGSSCVPRRNGATVKVLFNGNLASSPDDWALISWNEISEGSYIKPMTRYGTSDLDVLSAVIRNGS